MTYKAIAVGAQADAAASDFIDATYGRSHAKYPYVTSDAQTSHRTHFGASVHPEYRPFQITSSWSSLDTCGAGGAGGAGGGAAGAAADCGAPHLLQKTLP